MFVSGLIPPVSAAAGSWWFIFHGTRLLAQEEAEGRYSVPQVAAPGTLGIMPDTVQYLGELDGMACFTGGCREAPEVLPKGNRLVILRELHGLLTDDFYAVAVRALHLIQWDSTHRYCGNCGGPVEWKKDERVKQCPACGHLHFPQISPAVIVAIRRENTILLARSPRFPAEMFSVLAGFVEAGETLEECLHREVREETGIEIANLRYFGSQGWPYPNSLMLGFKADYAGGEIRVDGVEVVEAGWFRPDRLPNLPGKSSIARALIDDFIQTLETEATH